MGGGALTVRCARGGLARARSKGTRGLCLKKRRCRCRSCFKEGTYGSSLGLPFPCRAEDRNRDDFVELVLGVDRLMLPAQRQHLIKELRTLRTELYELATST